MANFENWLRSLNKARRTIRGYTTDIQQLLDFLEREGRLDETIGTDDLVAFLAEQQKGGAKSRTLDRKRAAFKVFFGYLVRFKQITDDPSRRLGVPIADYELPLTLTEDEVRGLLEAAQDHSRDLAILHLFANCGLRISELCDLKLEHIDLKESILYVKGRFVPLPPDTKVALKAWLDQIEGDEIFTITPRAIRLLVKKYAAAAGIRKTVRPSLLRHTFGVLSLLRGEDYETVKLTLGHEIDECGEYRRFKRAFDGRTRWRRRGPDPDFGPFAGEPIAVHVVRRCQPENTDATVTSSYTAPDRLLEGRPDPKFGGPSTGSGRRFAYYTPALYAGWRSMNSYIYCKSSTSKTWGWSAPAWSCGSGARTNVSERRSARCRPWRQASPIPSTSAPAPDPVGAVRPGSAPANR